MIKYSALTLAAPVIFLISGCGRSADEQNLRYFNSIDNQVAWCSNSNGKIIEMEGAPSGMYVAEINASNPYSVTFALKDVQISKKALKKARLKAQVKIESLLSEPLLVIDIQDKDGNSLEWLPVGVEDKNGTLDQWQELRSDVDLTVNNRNSPGNSFKVYVSNGRPESAFVDNIEVVFED